MTSENVTKLLTELIVARNVIEPQIEGLTDFQRLNIQPATKQVVGETLARFDKRAKRINEAVAALESLNMDSYPELPNIDATEEVLADLQAQVSTIGAAFSKFGPEKASTLGVTVGAPVDK